MRRCLQQSSLCSRALGAIGLILQALPMFFYKFDEKKFEKEIASFREEKEKKLQAEIEAAEALEGVEFEG